MEKLKQKTTFREDVGKFLLDYSKLVFGGIVLGSIISGEHPQAVLVVGGLMCALLFCFLGLLFVKKDLNVEKIKNNMEEMK